jgi:segregation and condensation protein B
MAPPDEGNEGPAPERDADAAPTAETLTPPALEEDTLEMSVPATAPAADTDEIPVAGDAAAAPPAEPEPEAQVQEPVDGQADGSGSGSGSGTEGEGDGHQEELPGVETLDPGRLEGIIESLLYASDRPLGLADLKRLVGERDGKKITEAMAALQARREGGGVVIISAAGGWQLRTNPENAPWVGKLLAGKPVRLSRAMLETLSIVAYRQPVTRPEIDDIRGVDCGPVLKTLLDRGLIRIIGKKEEVGRPLLYGTTPEFLRTFSLRDLTELPTLREFHELGSEERAKVDAETPGGPPPPIEPPAGGAFLPHPPLTADPEADDGLLEDLDRAAQAAARATEAATEPTTPEAEAAPPPPDGS